ncbi:MULTISPECIES: hypothetical protein [unclassified Pseudoxanthomonas]|uniref:hypothetical protein n=1 Tax=unclassified Pseudoxanthomonas TaxID=2645906 RepID=UPI001E480369|nr:MULTISPECIES: hypothetical protein [unclassified Pseudoxanthomonas]
MDKTKRSYIRKTALNLAVTAALLLPVAQAAVAAERIGAREPAGLSQAQPDGRLVLEVDRDSAPADGQSHVKVRVRFPGAPHQSADETVVVTLEATAGIWQLPGASSDEAGLAPRDADRVMPGIQVALVNGEAEAWLLAPIDPQVVTVQAVGGGSVARGEVSFIPELREMIALGVVDGVFRFDRKNPLALDQARPDDGFEEQINSWSRESGDGKRSAALRSAFFLKGKVRGDALLTMAYDSDKPGHDRLFRDIDPERWYPVYGDASIVGFEARSSSRLYLRLDKGRHYLMYGDIATGDGFSQRHGQGDVASTQVRDLGQYNRAMTGVRGHLENDKGALDVFAARDTLRQVVEEFPGRGLSGPYTVSNSENAVLGTERVEIITRDRYAPSRIVDVRTLSRFADYTFEPFSGRIVFVTPVSSMDSALNPVSVRITYEVDQGGESYWVYGVNGQFRPIERLEIGGSYVKDENPLAPFELGSANATFSLGQNTWVRGEYARTRSLAGSVGGNLAGITATPGEALQGDAWRAEFGHRGERASLLAWFGRSDAEFENPASSYLGGRRQAGVDGTLTLVAGDPEPRWALYTQANYVEDEQSEAERTQAQLGVRFTPTPAFTLEVGANHVSEHAGTSGSNGLVVPRGLGSSYGVASVSSSTAVGLGSGQTLYNTGAGYSSGFGSWVGNGLAGVPVEYTALRIASRYRIGERFDLTGEVEQDLNHADHRRASLGAEWQVHDQTRLFGRYEWNTGLSTVATSEGVTNPLTGVVTPSPYETNAFVFGLDTEYMEGGSLFNEYRMYDSFGARQMQWASGLRNLWHVTDSLTLQTGFERLEILDGDGQKSTAATLAAEWRPSELWLVNGRLEWRKVGVAAYGNDNGSPIATDASYDSWMSTVTVARKIDRDWTLLVRNYYLRNEYRDERDPSYEDRFQLGFAYRDTDTNRINVLGKYEFWTRRDNSLLASGLPEDDLLPRANGYDKHVVSLHADWHPNRVWWLTGRLAGKRQTDIYADEKSRYTAYLAGGRVTYGLSERWDVSAMAYRMWSPGGGAQYALGAEVGYLLTSNLWLSAGFNERGFRDDDMTGAEYTNQGAFLRLRFKFDEDLFRGNDPATNRALPR